MSRISTFALGLALAAIPMAAATGPAHAQPNVIAVDYQSATDTVVARGLSQVGVPYSWGGGGVSGPSLGTGTGATTVGFDASGLVQYAYAGAGLKLPRSSGEMYRVGQQVSPAQAQKGDLIFYGPLGAQAVSLYLGGNKMLEVADRVEVSPVRTAGMAPYLVRILGAQPSSAQALPGQAGPAQAVPGQATPAQTAPAQTVPGQTAPAQTVPGQAAQTPAVPSQAVPAQSAPAQTIPGLTLPSLLAPLLTPR